MTPRQVLAAIRAEGVTLTATEAGKIRYDKAPSAPLLALLKEHKAEVLALLAEPYQRGQCGEAAGASDDGTEWELPPGLIAVVDDLGRFRGWMLDPAWKP